MPVRTSRLFENAGATAIATPVYTVATGERVLVKQVNFWAPANNTVTMQVQYGAGTPRTFLVRAIIGGNDLLQPLYMVLNAGDSLWLANSPSLGARTNCHGVVFVLP